MAEEDLKQFKEGFCQYINRSKAPKDICCLANENKEIFAGFIQQVSFEIVRATICPQWKLSPKSYYFEDYLL